MVDEQRGWSDVADGLSFFRQNVFGIRIVLRDESGENQRGKLLEPLKAKGNAHMSE